MARLLTPASLYFGAIGSHEARNAKGRRGTWPVDRGALSVAGRTDTGVLRVKLGRAPLASPEAMVIESVTAEHIAAIWDAYGLGVAETMVRAKRGCSNACFLVNDRLVVRFQVTDLPVHKFRREKAAYDLLRGDEPPVPEAVALDESRALVPYPFLITTRLPGRTVFDSWHNLDADARERVAFDAGRCQALLHRHTLPAFGELSSLAEGGFATWRAYLEDYIARNARRARSEGLLDAAIIRRIERLLGRFQTLIDSVTSACLLHGDYQFENILQQDGKVTGIIDFEWAMAGDPISDCKIDGALAECAGSVEPFYAGYASLSPLPDHHRLMADFYRLLMCLESVACWGADPTADWMADEYRDLWRLLDELERMA